MLDAKTELALYYRYRDHGDMRARDKLIGNGLRFVITLARRYSDNEDRLKDLVSAGNIGLLVALDKYDPLRNTRFLTYATNWILLYIRNEIYDTHLVTIPLWRQKMTRKIQRVCDAHAAATGNSPPPDKICAEVGVSPEQLKGLLVSKFRYLDLDTTNCSCDGVEAHTAHQELHELLEELISTLLPKEQYILRTYYGAVQDSWSLRQIANTLGMTSERVRQIKEKALQKLRTQLNCSRLNELTD